MLSKPVSADLKYYNLVRPALLIRRALYRSILFVPRKPQLTPREQSKQAGGVIQGQGRANDSRPYRRLTLRYVAAAWTAPSPPHVQNVEPGVDADDLGLSIDACTSDRGHETRESSSFPGLSTG
ncbi:hypothetical protein QC762_119920 [Podospora pseudocomata]|uniref:Uncharacterized protein n=1 Tax=Podospora pseudocomata TaxID=2093779 RepID=A0ABR0GXP1_9PEZI|nr:hypothetical protein QC762_119920 [Podospora pseudocomata]